MKPKEIKRLIAFATVFATACTPLFSALTPEESKKLSNYIKEISTANPKAAKDFLGEGLFLEKLKLEKPLLAPALISKAEAIKDLEALLDKRWLKKQEMQLSKALEIRIDNDKPLVSVGIGPEPEKLLLWIERFKKTKYTKFKKGLIAQAIRKYESVFGTTTVKGKPQWVKMTIRERNVYLAEKAHRLLEMLINRSNNTSPAFQNKLKNVELLKYLSPVDRARFQRYIKQLQTSEIAKSKLKAAQLARLSNLPIEQQIYTLGQLFDNSKVSGVPPEMEKQIDALRRSTPKENLTYQQRQLLAQMLRTSLINEVSQTAVGNRIAKFYGRHPLKIDVKSCQNCYAKFEPSCGKIVLDVDLIQQYLRVKDMSASDLLKSKKELANLTKFLSPMFAHEATHQMQHAWSDSMNIYKPYSQEDEIEANSAEAVFTLEKMKKDAAFKKLMREMKGYMPYADKRLKIAERFKKNPEKFSEYVRQVYYYGLPSFAQVKSEVLSAVGSELERRKSLNESEKKQIEDEGCGLPKVMKMTAQEIIQNAPEIKTVALRKIQHDLLNDAAYSTHYEQAQEWTEMVFSMIGSGGKTKKKSSLASTVPAPK